MQGRAHGAGVFRGAHGIFHLAKDLRLAQHHRVQPAGYPKDVARSIVALQRISMRTQQGWRHAAAVCQPLKRVLQLGFVAGAIDFSAIAG